MGRFRRFCDIARLRVSNTYSNVSTHIRKLFSGAQSTGIHHFRDIPTEPIGNPVAIQYSSEEAHPNRFHAIPNFPYLPEPVDFEENYVECFKKQLNVSGKLKKVGNGKFGVVIVGIDKTSCNSTDSRMQSGKAFRKCAVKVLSAKNRFRLEQEDDARIEQLIRFGELAANEIRILTELSHPNIIEYYDCMVMNHQSIPAPTMAMIKMEHMDISLEDMLISSKRNMSMMEVKPLSQQIGPALVYLHEKGIVHHDVKPGNIMVNCFDEMGVKTKFQRKGKRIFSPNNIYKLIDFGFVRRYHEYSRECLLAVPVGGTFLFLPPEMKLGDKFKRTAIYNPYLTDAFAFGATLVCALEGMLEYDGEDLEKRVHDVIVKAQKALRTLQYGNENDVITPNMIEALRALKSLVATNLDERAFITEDVLNAFDY